MQFVRDVGDGILPSWEGIVQRRRGQEFSDAERQWQLLRRGRYLEFNLLYDRGVKFGLDGGRWGSPWGARLGLLPPCLGNMPRTLNLQSCDFNLWLPVASGSPCWTSVQLPALSRSARCASPLPYRPWPPPQGGEHHGERAAAHCLEVQRAAGGGVVGGRAGRPAAHAARLGVTTPTQLHAPSALPLPAPLPTPRPASTAPRARS